MCRVELDKHLPAFRFPHKRKLANRRRFMSGNRLQEQRNAVPNPLNFVRAKAGQIEVEVNDYVFIRIVIADSD